MSNLLEKASIVTTPTAYDNGKILSVKPAPSLGSELITNGDFSNGETNWDFGGDWTLVNGTAEISTSTNSFLVQSNVVDLSVKTYKIQYEVVSTNGSNFRFAGGNSAFGTVNLDSATIGVKTLYLKSNGTKRNLQFNQNAFRGSITNVSVKEVIDGDFDFTRNSSATRVNSAGLIEDVQILSSNLVSNGDFSQEGSEQITNGDFATDLSGWSYPVSGVTWDNGKAQIDALDGAFKYIQQIITTSGTKAYKISFDVSNIQGVIQLIISNNLVTEKSTNGSFEVYYTTSATNPTIQFKRKSGTNTFFELDNVSVKEVGQDWTLGTGWSIGENKVVKSGTDLSYLTQSSLSSVVGKTYRVKASISNMTTGNIRIDNFTDGTVYASDVEIDVYYTATSVGNFRFLGWNGFNGSITNISVIEITDDTNLPRIDYTGGEGHWLFEPQSTNLIPNANQYSGNTVYYTVTPNQSSPDGENNATLFVEKTSTAFYFVNSDNASIVGGQTYAYSFFVKYAGLQNLPVNASDGISGFSANIDILNGTVNSGTAEIKDFGNGWFRVSMIRTVAASASNAKIQFNFGNKTGDGTSGFYLFGYQIEQLSYATSYIPTNGSTVTRLQDAAFGSGSSDLINSTEGVLYAEIAALADDGTLRNISLSKDTVNRVNILYRNGSNRMRFIVRVNNTNVFDTSITLSNITNYNKLALSFKENEFKVYVNGVKEVEQLSGSIFPTDTLDKLNFNQNSSGGSPFYGKTKCVAVFKEALTDEELTCLTTI